MKTLTAHNFMQSKHYNKCDKRRTARYYIVYISILMYVLKNKFKTLMGKVNKKQEAGDVFNIILE